ncbi:SRPBCC family protein [Nocardia sp. NPDC088792]|uniref:SRPBCC family protein n=1 Tax=Nocardia sp. NPDC088792 TaxID=3364332 RepID=UPI00381D37F5
MPKPLEASIDIAATPEQVWGIVSDLKRIPEFSPATLRMQPLGRVHTGTWTVHLNRAQHYVYPTTGRVVRYEPNRAIAFRINENRTIWSYTLEPTADGGTHVVQRRDIPRGVSWFSRKATDAALGGEQPFEAALIAGMEETLRNIKAALEH